MFEKFSQHELVCALENNLRSERGGLVVFIRMLSVVDSRKLYAGLGYPSLFAFCTEKLKLSESCAQKRIHVCRMSAKFPVALDYLEKGRLHLTALSMLAPHLRDDNFETLLKSAVGKTQDELRQMLAINFVIPEKKDSMKLVKVKTALEAGPNLLDSVACVLPASDTLLASDVSQATKALPSIACAAREVPEPQTKTPTFKTEVRERASISFQCSKELFENIKRCQELLRHKHPNGRLEDVVSDLVEQFLDKKDPKRKEDVKKKTTVKTEKEIKPEKHSRYIPAEVKRRALRNANYQCTFESQGVRCKATAFLEFDHKVPFSRNGKNTADNIHVLCSAHNKFKARLQFGGRFMNQFG